MDKNRFLNTLSLSSEVWMSYCNFCCLSVPTQSEDLVDWTRRNGHMAENVYILHAGTDVYLSN